MYFVRRGRGKPLLLVHGLGGSYRSWDTIAGTLALQRELIAVDLPGFGATPPLENPSIASLADAVTAFLTEHGLLGIDAAGSSMGARLVLELARRGVIGNTVALDPGGFWRPWERIVFGASVGLSIRLVRALERALPALTTNAVTRSVLMAQFSAHPWTIPARAVLTELRTFAAAPSFDPVLRALVEGPLQEGATDTPGRVVIGWGTRDLVCFPQQAARAHRAFPAARLHWFENCGHFPQWDSPGETVHVILQATQ